MIKSFYNIGQVLAKQEEYQDYFNPWANPFPKLKPDVKAIVIIADIVDGQLNEKLAQESFRTSYVNKYLFREAKARATNLVPTFYLQAQSDAEKQVDSIRKMVDKVRQSVKNYKHNFLTDQQISRIEQKLLATELKTGTSYLFTVRIDGKYMGDFEQNRKLFLDEAYQKYSKDSSSQDKICSVTYEPAQEVWGRIDTLGFTVYDISFCRNGFEPSESYKMFPVSSEAVKILEGSKRVILEKLSKNFFGMKYFVLPRFIEVSPKREEQIILNLFRVAEQIDNQTLQSQSKSIIHNETIINAIIERDELSDSSVYYDIFFYQPNNAQFMIKLHVSDILPSRFKAIMEVKERVEKIYYQITTIEIPAKKLNDALTLKYDLTFGKIKDYFSKKNRIDTVFHPYFFKIVEAVFYDQPLNREQVLRAFMDKIRIIFKDSANSHYAFPQEVKQTFVIFQYFNQLGLFPNTMPTETNRPVALTLEAFEEQHQDFFDVPLKKASFYLGCMTEKLLEKQRNQLKSEPFKKYLNGLNIDYSILLKIQLKLEAKIDQYHDKFLPTEIRHIESLNAFAHRILIMGAGKLSKTEISYAFATGLAMQKEFTKEQIRVAIEAKKNQTQNS